MQALTIHEAAATTGWSARMLRYLERVGLLEPSRSASGYRMFGGAELQRLRTLRELLGQHGIALSDVAFAKRLRDEPELADAVAGWLEARPRRPETVTTSDWLRFEQDKCRKLLASAAA
jgi:MerR family copper efflux transcriptional regulator